VDDVSATGVLATYGAVVATLSLSWQVYAFRRRRADEAAARRGILRLEFEYSVRGLKVIIHNDSDFAVGVAWVGLTNSKRYRSLELLPDRDGVPSSIQAHSAESFDVAREQLERELYVYDEWKDSVEVRVRTTTGASFVRKTGLS